MAPRSLAPPALATVLALLLGCGTTSGATHPPETGGGEVISCAPWYRLPIPGTQAVLVNNFWNEQWAGDRPREQCLLRRPAEGGGAQYGWRWSWPAYEPYTSYASPEALIGWKPWDGGASTSPDLPRRIDALASLEVDFAVRVTADDTHNLNTTMWVTASDVATAAPNPGDIRNEIMVWFANPADLGGGITYDGEVTLDGVVFDRWHLVNHSDDSGGSTQEWTMIIYASRTDRYAASFDLALVLEDCVRLGLVDPAHAVGGVELLTEVFGGRGELWLERFDLRVTGR